MQRKNIILILGSAIAVILLATAAVLMLVLIDKHNTSTAEQPTIATTGPKPGTVLDASKTPAYGACSFVTATQLQAAFGASISQIGSGTSSGIVATNQQSAETCTYPFSTANSSNDSLAISVYRVNPDNPSEDVLDSSWAQVAGAKNVSYYKTAVSGKTTNYVFHILNGPTVIQATISAPTNDGTFNYGSAMQILQSLEENGDYTAASAALPAPAN